MSDWKPQWAYEDAAVAYPSSMTIAVDVYRRLAWRWLKRGAAHTLLGAAALPVFTIGAVGLLCVGAYFWYISLNCFHDAREFHRAISLTK